MIAILRRSLAILLLAAAPSLSGCAMFNGHPDAKANGKGSAVAKTPANKQPAGDHFPTAAEAGL